MKLWKRLLWAGIVVLCLIGAAVLCHGDRETVAELVPQLAAERWETAEKPYTLASVFLEPDAGVPQSSLNEIRLNVENALTAGGVSSEEYRWYYSASYQTEGKLVNGVASCDVEITAIAGEFFRIHPMVLRNGWYMDESEVMHDRIVLSREAAWDLFYSDNVAGLFCELNGQRYQVAAVVDLESGKYNEMAAGEIKRAWVFADSPGLESEELAAPGFTCMEMVLPQPVKDFATTTMKGALQGFIPEDTLITDNSSRFGLKNRWDVLRNIGLRGVVLEPIAYPYWENAARLTENHLALRLVPEGILLGIPAISLIVVLLWLNHRRTWGLHSIRDAVENAIDRKHQRDYDARLRGEEPQRRRRPRKDREFRPKFKGPRFSRRR